MSTIPVDRGRRDTCFGHANFDHFFKFYLSLYSSRVRDKNMGQVAGCSTRRVLVTYGEFFFFYVILVRTARVSPTMVRTTFDLTFTFPRPDYPSEPIPSGVGQSWRSNVSEQVLPDPPHPGLVLVRVRVRVLVLVRG